MQAPIPFKYEKLITITGVVLGAVSSIILIRLSVMQTKILKTEMYLKNEERELIELEKKLQKK